jgi:hypothetical protein
MEPCELGNHRTLTAVLIIGLAAGCASPRILPNLVAEHGLANDSLVRLDDSHAVAASLTTNGQVQVVWFAHGVDGWSAEVIATGGAGRSSEGSAHLFGFGGDSGEMWNTFFFGTAPSRTSRVTLDGFAYEGGQVSDGAWVIALKEQDVTPDQLRWTFRDATGGTIASGTGIFPPDA